MIGDVRIGADSSIWPGAVLRGDYGTIIVGERTSIQDGAVIHAVDEYPTVIGSDCVVGHLAHLEGCVVHDRVLVGSGSIVLHEAEVHSGATVGAGAVVRNRDGRCPPTRHGARACRRRCGSDSCDEAVAVASAALYAAQRPALPGRAARTLGVRDRDEALERRARRDPRRTLALARAKPSAERRRATSDHERQGRVRADDIKDRALASLEERAHDVHVVRRRRRREARPAS